MSKVHIGPNSYEVLVKAEDCGTGAGGFKPGNDCASGDGGVNREGTKPYDREKDDRSDEEIENMSEDRQNRDVETLTSVMVSDAGEEILRELPDALEGSGWELEDHHVAMSGSEYITIGTIDAEPRNGYDTIKIRVAGHEGVGGGFHEGLGSRYREEDISILVEPKSRYDLIDIASSVYGDTDVYKRPAGELWETLGLTDRLSGNEVDYKTDANVFLDRGAKLLREIGLYDSLAQSLQSVTFPKSRKSKVLAANRTEEDLIALKDGANFAKSHRIKVKVGDCGQESDGTFGAGNDCASGDGSSSSDKPKGAPGNDKDKQQAQTKTPEFKEWFDKSQVVDANGQPLVVYHQTTQEFDTFDPDKATQGVFWFTSTEEKARGGTGLGPVTTPPKEGTGASRRAGDPWIVKEVYLSAQNLAGWDEYENLYLEQIQSRGFDGIKLDDDYIIFDNKQIKSATDNNGSFGLNEANTTKSYRVTLKAGDCGQVDDGTFGPGNDCAAGRGGSGSDKPKGAPGEDKEKQKEQQQTPEFKEWFDEKGVKDDDGNPMQLYHGTASEFDDFSDASEISVTDARSSKMATFFTDDPATAKAYAVYASEDGPVKSELEKARKSERAGDWDGYDRHIREAEKLDTSKARYERRKQNARTMKVFARGDFLVVDAGGKSPQELSTNDNIDSWLTSKLKEAKRQGKDGVRFNNLDDAVGLYDRPATHFAIFNADGNVKSSENNIGDFGGDNANINKSYTIKVKVGDCGQVDDGTFGPGNDCAAGDGTGSDDKPKGAPGEDKDKQKEQQETPEFKEWFGDSKALGKDGKPLIVWHGTGAEVDGNFVFDPKMIGSSTDVGFYGTGFYFVGEPHSGGGSGEAGYYGRNVHGFYLKMDNPLELNTPSTFFMGDPESFVVREAILEKANLMPDEMREHLDVYKREVSLLSDSVSVYKLESQEGYVGSISDIPKGSMLKYSVRTREQGTTRRESDGKVVVMNYPTKKEAKKATLSEAWKQVKEDNYKDSVLNYDLPVSMSDHLRINFTPQQITTNAKGAGFDSIIFGDEYIVFEADQIKSAEFNTGDFDKGDDRVGKSFKSYRITLDEKQNEKITLTTEDTNEQP